MDCVYINLDGQAKRRAFLEANFTAHNKPGWPLERIAAVDTAQVRQLDLPGQLRDTEKAAILSHAKALEHVLASPGHALILEDDVLFGPDSFERIESATRALAEDAWDLIFTDVSLVEPQTMTRLFILRRELARTGEEMLLPLRDILFCGSSSYVVNHHFKQPLRQLLRRQYSFDQAIDLYLRRLIQEGELRAFVTFPFVTSLSAYADNSQSQPRESEQTDIVWNAMRRFFWLHRDIGEATMLMERLGADFVDPEAQAFARLLGAAVSDKMVLK